MCCGGSFDLCRCAVSWLCSCGCVRTSVVCNARSFDEKSVHESVCVPSLIDLVFISVIIRQLGKEERENKARRTHILPQRGQTSHSRPKPRWDHQHKASNANNHVRNTINNETTTRGTFNMHPQRHLLAGNRDHEGLAV